MAIVLDQPETDAVQPPNATKHILVNRGIREEVHDGKHRQSKHRKFHFLPIRIKVAVRRSESLQFAARQIQPQSRRKLSAEQAKRGTGVDARGESNDLISALKNQSNRDTHSFRRVGMKSIEIDAIHGLPTPTSLRRESPDLLERWQRTGHALPPPLRPRSHQRV